MCQKINKDIVLIDYGMQKNLGSRHIFLARTFIAKNINNVACF